MRGTLLPTQLSEGFFQRNKIRGAGGHMRVSSKDRISHQPITMKDLACLHKDAIANVPLPVSRQRLFSLTKISVLERCSFPIQKKILRNQSLFASGECSPEDRVSLPSGTAIHQENLHSSGSVVSTPSFVPSHGACSPLSS